MPKAQATAHLQSTLWPVLAGYGFQQTALIGMLPVLAHQLYMPPEQIGMAIGAGLITSAILTPLLSGMMTEQRLKIALIVLLATSLALIALLLVPQPINAAFTILLAIRCIQGTAAATVLTMAQGSSADTGQQAITVLARIQFIPGHGRALGAALIGPLVRLSIILPILPAIAGAIISLYRLSTTDRPIHPFRSGPSSIPRPWLAALVLPFLIQCSVGAGQLGIGPLLAQTRSPEQAATIAGICLGAGYLALPAVHYLLTPKGMSVQPVAGLLTIAQDIT